MSVRVSGSDKRLSLKLPAEGQGWKRQGDEMVPADLAGGGGGGAQAFHGWAKIVTTGAGGEQVFSSAFFSPARQLDGGFIAGYTNSEGAILLPAGTLANLRIKAPGLSNAQPSPAPVATVTVVLDGNSTELTATVHGDSGLTIPGPLPVLGDQLMQVIWSIDLTDETTSPLEVALFFRVEFTPA